MATTPTTSSTSASKSPAKNGSNRQPKRQTYKAFRPDKKVKRWTETLKSKFGASKLSPEQRSAVAFFMIQPERNGSGN
jgi:hypothetical protein